MEQASNLEEVLLRLGGTAEDVATTLKASGVKGVRNTVRYLNPVIRYVQQELRLDEYDLKLVQTPATTVYRLRLTRPNGVEEEAGLPDAVTNFLAAFNQGAHPDLELPP